MIKPCVRCKFERESEELENIRGDIDLEGYVVTQHPEVLYIPENDAINVCVNCLRVLKERNNNNQSIRNKSRNANELSTIRESEDIPVPSQSVQSLTGAPFSTSVEKQSAIPNNESINIEKLKEPGEIEKLTKNPEVQRKVRKLIQQSMPMAAKKRKLSEMLGYAPNLSSESSSNSELETIIGNSPQPPPPRTMTDEERAQVVLMRYLSQNPRINRSYRELPQSTLSQNQRVSPSQSLDSTNHNLSVSSHEIVQVPSVVISQSPVINIRPQHPQQPRQIYSPPPALLYEPDSSSDSDRVRNSSLESNNGTGRRSSERIASKRKQTDSSSDDGEVARRRINESRARRASSERRAAQASVERRRQQNDGNDHSNLAAPRRINIELPSTTRNQRTIKDTTGG